MKKIINILGLAAVTLTVISCQDWLDMPSDTKVDSTTVFESVSRAEKALLGCYSSTFNRELYYQFGMGTDECFSTESDNNSKNNIGNYVYTTSNAPSSTYNAMYTGIEYANICIKNLPKMSVSESEQKRVNMLLGEAYAIRAMNYLNIVRYFGDAPYPTIPVEDIGVFTSSRVSRDTILDGCVKDLQTAIDLLPWKSAGMVSGSERITKNVAYGLLARTALYAAGYSLRWDLTTVPYDKSTVKLAQRDDPARIKALYKIAADACGAVIAQKENGLLPTYEEVFRDLVASKYNDETMLEYGQYGTNVNGTANGYTNGIFCHTSSMYMKSQPAMAAVPTYYFDFDEKDQRRDVTICNYGITSKNVRQMNPYGNNTIGKFRATWKTEVGTAVNKRDINFPILRYSDVLLMYAEALNELNNGPTSEAIKAYEEVRLRAFGNDKALIGTTPTTYAAFKNAVIEERKLELGFEGWRRTDLIRWGILYEKLAETKQRLFNMVDHKGEFANVDIFRAYKAETATSFEDPVVAVPFVGYKEHPLKTDSLEMVSKGYTWLDMTGSVAPSGGRKIAKDIDGTDQTWILNLYRGMCGDTRSIQPEGKNKVECVPLNQTSIIDINTGLTGEQHPCY
ncbi:MAG: RagB/SusD family nutrient uptake outer membrane protein [Bacteroides sp.]|jgi:hypothetical protein|nr:RagB/SusD family nutrient uptake outer membrane protein [Bacteroides sp.]